MDEPDDPYADGTHEYWSLSEASPELVSALADRWLTAPAQALDLGCGLATDAAYLANLGFAAWGVDLSPVALRRAKALHGMVRLVRADVRSLPFRDQCFDLLLDRGTIHYLSVHDREDYAKEASRVLRPGGRFLLRACLYSAGYRNDVDATAIREVFSGWSVDWFNQQDLITNTKTIPALVFRLRKAG